MPDVFKVPALVVIVAFVTALVATVAWTNAELKTKVDRAEMQYIRDDISQIKTLLLQNLGKMKP